MGTKGTLYIIAAASGTGKTSLARALSQSMDNIIISISHTTRPVRGNEDPDQSYFFSDKNGFEALIEQGAFLEYAQVFGNYYGTSHEFVENQLHAGIDVILDIDWQGARQVRDKIDCTSIFLLPPSREELRSRLEGRKREDSQLIEERLAAAGAEISHYKEFDYVVINDKFEDALSDLQAIVRSRRLLLSNQKVRYSTIIKELVDKKL